MRNFSFLFAAIVAVMLCSENTAEGTLLYDMETPGAQGPDGFGPNGPSTITQSTIGATENSNSLRFHIPDHPFSMITSAAGALTSIVPAALANPPGVQSILFDMTISTGDEYTGNFADIGVTINRAGGGGLQSADTELISGKTAGLYSDVRIDLIDSAGNSFNDIFGNSIVVSFQLLIRKNFDAPLTVYIDNIRAVVPEPGSLALLVFGALPLGLLRRRKIGDERGREFSKVLGGL